MPHKNISPRIFIIVATAADEAAIFLRGPSDWYHLMHWDMTHEKFESGAWFRGRIYPEKCDLSPDGKLLLYFVHQGRKYGTSYTDAWTGLSRSPWLTALGVWPQGTTYGGGGRFLSNREVILRAGHVEPHPNHPAIGLRVQYGDAPEHISTGEVDGADWTGHDRQGRLIFALGGNIFRRSADGTDCVVADLNNLAPDPKPSPGWASRPLVLTKEKGGERDAKKRKAWGHE